MGKLSDQEAEALKEALRLSRGGDLAAAEPIFHAVLKTTHGDPIAEWIFGYEYLNHDQPAEAVDHFRRAIQRDERCAPAWGGLGRALKDLGKWDEAEAALRRRLELGESANHHVFLAMVLLERSRYEDALNCCERALQLDERQVDALIIQGFASSLLGRHEKALELCRRAVAVDEQYSEAHDCLRNANRMRTSGR